MLQREDLPSIAQRTLGKQADLRQRIEDDPRRLDALDRLENQPGRLSELEIRRIKEALLLVAIEQTFGRHHFKNVDAVEAPTVRRRGGLQLWRGLGQGDVEAAFARRSALHQKAQRHGGLAGAGTAFEQEDPSRRKAPEKNVIEARHASAGLGRPASVFIDLPPPSATSSGTTLSAKSNAETARRFQSAVLYLT